ncbi:MAG: ABC transporter permease [Cyanobacteria bacterium LVE1205-1]
MLCPYSDWHWSDIDRIWNHQLVWGEFKGNLGLGIMIVLLSILAYVGVGFIVGTQLARRTEDVTAIIAAVGVPLLILGGAFLPASLFPEALLNIAKFNPIYHMTEALNDVSANGKTIKDIEDHLNFLILFAITMVIGGWISYQIMVQVEKQL